MKPLAAALFAALACIATPAFAGEFSVVQDKTTMKCSVVETVTTTTHTVIGVAGAYQTMDDATAAMSKVTTCTKS
ncbi:MAG: hypothetical protein NT133_25320 [Alphaproteobacteria bacterium]|nr:hypothetical protein [Alphaproteobacteria bacterium]